MNHFLCIHGHFYQPPRENPWLEEVEIQTSAHPYHDWNERITAECYRPNTAARILGSDGMIADIVNNYSMISFNFGPTLLSWMEEREPDVYRAILEADKISSKRFSGHGSAIAQPYNHVMMPLANMRDKHTQVAWGIRDFVHRFGREPEGMWLPETGVDLETLDVLAEHGIRFTILSPHQASKVRPLDGGEWEDVSGATIDPRRPYVCKLPSGKMINIFFYDGPISADVSFSDLLETGEKFAGRLTGAFSDSDDDQLVHIASDGEVYGHHKNFTEMGLAWCLRHLEREGLAEITIYGEYLDGHPPTREVAIVENSSWSCAHGVERWRSDCGCATGMHAGWTQAWRAPLRQGLDELRDRLIALFENEMASLADDPWAVRDDYISVILNRDSGNIEEFVRKHLGAETSPEQKLRFLKLLEIQRHAMLMFTSCGWFFDDINRLEPVQILQYAARAIQLAHEISGEDYESELLVLLAEAPSNDPELKNGAQVYQSSVKPNIFDFRRVCAHYALLALSGVATDKERIGSYSIRCSEPRVVEAGGKKLMHGTLEIGSPITLESTRLFFLALDSGELELEVSILDPSEADRVAGELEAALAEKDWNRLNELMENGSGVYHLADLGRDYQLRVLEHAISKMVLELDDAHSRFLERYYGEIRAVRRFDVQLPAVVETVFSSAHCGEVLAAVESAKLTRRSLRELKEKLDAASTNECLSAVAKAASRRIEAMLGKLTDKPDDHAMIRDIGNAIEFFQSEMGVELDLWKSQNTYMSLLVDAQAIGVDAISEDGVASRGVDQKLIRLGRLLGVNRES